MLPPLLGRSHLLSVVKPVQDRALSLFVLLCVFINNISSTCLGFLCFFCSWLDPGPVWQAAECFASP